jgi:hypothetical protein
LLVPYRAVPLQAQQTLFVPGLVQLVDQGHGGGEAY